MRATRTIVGLAAVLAAGTGAVALPGGAAAQALDQVVAPGDPVVRSGTGCLLPGGAPGLVVLLVERIPRAGKYVGVGQTDASADGSWTVHGTTPDVSDGDYPIIAACGETRALVGAFPLADQGVLRIRRPQPTTTTTEAPAPEEPAGAPSTTRPPAPARPVAPRAVTVRPRFTG